jgi:hypothetical protein
MIENAKPKVDQPQSGDMPSGREVKLNVEEVKPKVEEIKPKEEGVKPKEEFKPIKKESNKEIVYQEASSSDYDDADEFKL